MKYNFSEIIYHVLGYWKWFAEINDSTLLLMSIYLSIYLFCWGIQQELHQTFIFHYQVFVYFYLSVYMYIIYLSNYLQLGILFLYIYIYLYFYLSYISLNISQKRTHGEPLTSIYGYFFIPSPFTSIFLSIFPYILEICWDILRIPKQRLRYEGGTTKLYSPLTNIYQCLSIYDTYPGTGGVEFFNYLKQKSYLFIYKSIYIVYLSILSIC